jgi:hypothetical protein
MHNANKRVIEVQLKVLGIQVLTLHDNLNPLVQDTKEAVLQVPDLVANAHLINHIRHEHTVKDLLR